MKRSLKSQPEPSCLRAFRESNPSANWNEFRDTGCYGTVRRTSARDQRGLCAYCERLLSDEDQQIAHFHPKSDHQGQINWGLHWPNLWLCCRGGDQTTLIADRDSFLPPSSENRSCDTAKESQIVDGIVLAPDEVPAFPRIFNYQQYADRVEIVADPSACDEAGIDFQRASETVRIFNLNCRRLSEARMRVHREIERQIKRLRENHGPGPDWFRSLMLRHLTHNGNQGWGRFFTMVRWRFRTEAEHYLQSINYRG
jgi:uncharacterized protein (TIGR02646 family)